MSDDDCEMASGNSINANAYSECVLMTYSNLVTKNVLIDIFKGKILSWDTVKSAFASIYRTAFSHWLCVFQWVHLSEPWIIREFKKPNTVLIQEIV